jgi:hypothetical protein
MALEKTFWAFASLETEVEAVVCAGAGWQNIKAKAMTTERCSFEVTFSGTPVVLVDSGPIQFGSLDRTSGTNHQEFMQKILPPFAGNHRDFPNFVVPGPRFQATFAALKTAY